MKEISGPIFLVLSSVTNLKEQFFMGPQATFTITLEPNKAFFRT